MVICSHNGFHKYSNRTMFLDGNPEDTCYYQGTRETLADTNLINIGEGIFKEALVTSTKEAAEVASEDEDTEASKEASTYQTVLSSKGSSHKRVVYSLSNAKMKKQKNRCLYDCSFLSQQKQSRKDVLYLSRLCSGNSKRDK